MFSLRKKPEEYRVSEIMQVRPKKKGNYAVFVLRKKGWTTMRAIEAIAKKINVAPTRFSVASYKRKCSVSSQYVSVSHVSVYPLRKLQIKDVFVDVVGYTDAPIRMGDAEGNEYSILVRHLDASLKMVDVVPNYYAIDKFGRHDNPHLHKIGKALLLENFEEACKLFLTTLAVQGGAAQRGFRKAVYGKWASQDFSAIRVPDEMRQEKLVIDHLRAQKGDFRGAFLQLSTSQIRYYIQAYQAYLFNFILASYICATYDDVRMLPLEILDAPIVVDVDDANLLPLVGYDYKLKQTGVGKIVADLLEKEGIALDMFLPFKIKTSSRAAFVSVGKLRLGSLDHDELHKKGLKKQKVQFILPLGSYPVVVLGCMDL